MAKRRPKPGEAGEGGGGAREEPSTGNYREIGARRCFADDTPIDRGGISEGWCPEGGGYAVADVVTIVFQTEDRREGKRDLARRVSCPFACPQCRGSLTWDGGCDRCHGSDTPQDPDTWTFPGDRYDAVGVDPRKLEGHYTKRAPGPRPVARLREVAGVMAQIKRDLADAGARTVPAVTAVAIAAEDPRPVRHSDTCDCATCVPF